MHQATRVEDAPTFPGRAPLSRGPLVGPLHLFQHPHTPSSRKNHQPAQARVLARFAVIFDLLAQSSIHKTALGDCCLVTLFLSLHVKFMRSQVILMHDIGSRHLWE